jgi:type II secretory pathway pseudopilin PulG
MRASSRTSRRGAFTLIEAAMATTIVAIMIGGGLAAVTQARKSRNLAEERAQARQVASMLLEEALALAYEDPQEPGGLIGPDTYEDPSDRFGFDDTDDYHGLLLQPVTDSNAAWLTDVSWIAEFRVVWIDLSDATAERASDTGIKRIELVLRRGDRIVLRAGGVKSRGWEALQ